MARHLLWMSPYRVVVQDLGMLARTRAAEMALAIERARLATGAVVAEPADLVGAYVERVPADPFDGAPLRYRLLGPGYLIYSVGEDGVDDGGRMRDGRHRCGQRHRR